MSQTPPSNQATVQYRYMLNRPDAASNVHTANVVAFPTPVDAADIDASLASIRSLVSLMAHAVDGTVVSPSSTPADVIGARPQEPLSAPVSNTGTDSTISSDQSLENEIRIILTDYQRDMAAMLTTLSGLDGVTATLPSPPLHRRRSQRQRRARQQQHRLINRVPVFISHRGMYSNSSSPQIASPLSDTRTGDVTADDNDAFVESIMSGGDQSSQYDFLRMHRNANVMNCYTAAPEPIQDRTSGSTHYQIRQITSGAYEYVAPALLRNETEPLADFWNVVPKHLSAIDYANFHKSTFSVAESAASSTTSSSTLSTTCPICLIDFEDNDDLVITPCQHRMHDACGSDWFLSENTTCPVCRVVCGRSINEA